MSIMEIKQVGYSYDNKKKVLKGVNAEMEQGKLYAILGPSGCGKTTLLSLIGGLDSPGSGQIYFDGQGYADTAKLDNVGKYHHDSNMWDYVRSTRIAVPDIWDVIAKEHRNMDKVQALFANLDERAAAWKELSELKELELVGSLSYNIEINAAGVNKGTALVALGKMLGIPRESIMACGDGDNDVHLLREVGFGVAMANAQSQVKDVADYITSSNDEDGVARAIEKFALHR